jgi:hypothetical protein
MAGSPIWAKSNPTLTKIGAVSQQTYAGAVATLQRFLGKMTCFQPPSF